MIDFLRNLQIDQTSFWLGFVAGALFLWIASRLRTYIPGTVKFLSKRIQEARESAAASIELRLRNDTIRVAQKQHLASMLFSLDEVAIEPRLIAPPIVTQDDTTAQPLDNVSITVPYAPDWPEVAAAYHSPTLTLPQALQDGANILLSGHPGSGKSFALAYLASRVAQRDAGLNSLSDFVPIYLHVANIPANIENQPLTQCIAETLSKNMPSLPKARLESLVDISFSGDRALLLIDGLDEMTPAQAEPIVAFIKQIAEKHPTARMVVTASHENHYGLPSIGLQPLAIATWTTDERKSFVANWGELWSKYISLPEAEENNYVSPRFLNAWLLTHTTPASPMEWTLKVWSAYAGDILGQDHISSIEAFLRRISANIPEARQALEALALQMICTSSTTLNPQDTKKCIEQFEPPAPATGEEITETDNSPTQSTYKVKLGGVLPALTDSGLITQYSDSRVGFIHTIFPAYLAGNILASSNNLSAIQEQPMWVGKNLTLFFFGRTGDITPVVQSMLKQDDLLHRQLLTAARWLSLAPKNAIWRAAVLRTLAGLLQKEAHSLNLVMRATAAIALSGDSGAGTLFRQMLTSEHANLRLASALGCGLSRDAKATNDLSELTADSNASVVRAACLALVAIDTKESMNAIATSLLHGNETLQRAAAEALANHPTEGHPTLKEGSGIENLMIRRAVVYGLLRVNQPWATEILENLSLEDKEWIVRNAAIQAVESLRSPNPFIPKPTRPVEDQPWLIEHAAKLGISVSPGKPARDLVLQIVAQGNEDQRLAALEYLRLHGDKDAIHHLYRTYFGTTGETHEAAYNALWQVATAGVELPSPQQFGMQ